MDFINKIESWNEIKINRIIAILFSVFLVYLALLPDIIRGGAPTFVLEPILILIGYFLVLLLIKTYFLLLGYFTSKISKLKLKNGNKVGLPALLIFSIVSGGVMLLMFLLWITITIVGINQIGDHNTLIESFLKLNPPIITLSILLALITTFTTQSLSLQKLEKLNKPHSYLISFTTITITAAIVWIYIKIMTFITMLAFF